MLIAQLIDLCDEKFNSFDNSKICKNCNHPIKCSGSCDRCLDQVHFPKYNGKEKLEYDCKRMLYFYVCKYSYRYSSEIFYALELTEFLKHVEDIHMVSIGCGATPDLMALEKFMDKYDLCKNVSYIGYDINEKWDKIHKWINEYSAENQYKTQFSYFDAVEFFREAELENANVLVLSYVISYFYNTGKIREINNFFDNITDNIVSKKHKNGILIIINDVNSCNRGRDYFLYFLESLKSKGFHGNVYKRYFNHDIKNDYQRYGEAHLSNQSVFDIPDDIKSFYSPATYCKSSQLIIEVI